MTTAIIVASVCLLTEMFFAAAEISIISLDRIGLRTKLAEGSRTARLLEAFLENKQRLYGLDARELRPVHEWVGGFERFWSESFDRLDAYVQDLK